MTRVLVWKEVREQGTVLAALIVLGAAVLIAASVLVEASDAGQATELRSLTAAGRIGLIMLTVTAGMVVGGTLFAGEREAGTFTFLDMLPGSRWRVWWRKVLAGAAMVAVAVGIFLGVSAVGGILDLRIRQTPWLMLFGCVALAAFGWGVLGSVLARTSLTACGIGLGYAMLTLIVVYPIVGIGLQFARHYYGLWAYIGNEYTTWERATLVAGYSLIAIPLPIAAWLYTAPDRSRKLAEAHIRMPGVRKVARAGLGHVPGLRWGAGWRRLLWLTVRQTRVTALALAGASLVAGCSLLPAEAAALAIWPILGLGVGVLVGVIGLADEQGTAAYRFWGERRMPIRRLWTVKVLSGMGLTLLIVVMLLVPAIIAVFFREDHGPRRPFVAMALRSGVMAEPEFPIVTFLLLWPAYGFTFGHLAALLFRKGVVAGAVGLLLGGTLAALWLPSLLAGGIHHWQVFLPLAFALLTARLMTWPWATERLGTRGPLVRLACGTVAVLVMTAVGIGYRVKEVPEVAEIEDDLAFAKGLPSFDEKQSGRDLRRAASLLNELPAGVRLAAPERPLPGALQVTGSSREQPYLYQIPAVLQTGWPADRPDLKQWLDSMRATSWVGALELAATKPTGVLEDPTEYAPNVPFRNIDGVRSLLPVYLARALQAQSVGDPAEMPKTAAVSLAAVRITRKDTFHLPALVSRGMELQVYQALDRWLEKLEGHPELLKQALAAVQEQERAGPYDPRSIQLAEQVMARNAVLAPSRWMANYFDEMRQGHRETSGIASTIADTETNMVGFAWTVPWEKERLRRVIGLGNRPGRYFEQHEYLRGMPGWSVIQTRDQAYRPGIVEGYKLVVAARRAAMLKLAIRLYASETGKLPEDLTNLVPKYLPEVPADPYDNKPFRYRISTGEQIIENRPPSTQPEPVAPIADAPPGLNIPMTEEDYQANAAVVGGLMCWPLEPGWLTRHTAPGMFPERIWFLDGVGGIVGGVIYWPRVSQSGMSYDDSPFRGPSVPCWDSRWLPPLPSAITIQQQQVEIPAGQGILWSIGPDGLDSGGTIAIDPSMAGQKPAGDLIYLIPQVEQTKEK